MSLRAVHRYVHTLRHLRPWQIVGRLLAAAKTRAGLPQLPDAPEIGDVRLYAQTELIRHDPWNAAADIVSGQFTFLTETRDLGRPVDWSAPTAPLLWQYDLHYFQYLHLLDETERDRLCLEWVEANPVGEGVGWKPYPLSLRILNWVRAGLSDPRLLESLYRQAAYLFRHLETFHPGNHLLENARALVYAGRFFDGVGESDHWLERGIDIYRDETPIQVLSDGGYFERTPMYHALMLEGYLDIVNLLPSDHSDRVSFAETAHRMADFLASVTHPDGQIPLFNDATQEIAPSTGDLLDYARRLTGYEPSTRCSFPETGYFVARGEDLHLVIDGGKIGPDYLPAHAHADIFSYELSLFGEQMITDSGVYEYAAGDMREYVRSTRAHNTVCVDDVDQAECWASFRVARRYDPKDVRFQREPAGYRFEGTFDGYARLIGDGIVHRRMVDVDTSARRIMVRDTVDGSGTHSVESRIQLHQEIEWSSSGAALTMERRGAVCRISVDRGEVRTEKGWYCPRFGVKQERDVIVVGGEVRLPVTLSYTISY